MTSWTNAWEGRRVILLYAIVALAMLAPGTAVLPLQDRDEPRFAQAAREMMERRDWVVPTFNGEYRFDKPPLIYWMMIGAYAIGGVSEWTARAPSALCAFLLAWVVWRAGLRWFSPRAGLLAGLMTLTHFQMVQHGRGAVADMPMILSVLVAQFALFELLIAPSECGPRARYFWGFYLALGIGFLAKGPVAILIPFLSLPIYWLLCRRCRLPLRRLKLLKGTLIVLAIVGAWGIPALIETNGEFARVGLGKHVVARGMESFEGHGAPFFFYLLSSPISLFPWSVFLPAGIAFAWRMREPIVMFLSSWILATFLLFSIYATKLPHYVMPAYPAIFLMLGRAIDLGISAGRAGAWWRNGLRGLVWLVIVALAIGSVLAWKFAPWPEVTLGLLGGALLLAGLDAIPRAVFQPRAASIALAGVLTIAGTELLARGLRAVNPTLRALPALADLPRDTRCAFSSYQEPSVVFYTNRRWETVDENEGIRAFAAGPGPRALLVRLREQRLKLSVSRPPDPGREAWFDALPRMGYAIQRVEGWNAARSSRVTIGVAVRKEEGIARVE